MLYLLGGFAILSGLLLLGYLFVNTDPARLARIVKWAGIVLAVAALVALLVPGRNSTVETAFIRMSLDHDTGAMTGTVLRGRFGGMRLEELRPQELLALL